MRAVRKRAVPFEAVHGESEGTDRGIERRFMFVSDTMQRGLSAWGAANQINPGAL